MQLDAECPLCHTVPETTEHVFMHCPISKLTLFSSQIGLHVPHNIDINMWIIEGLQCEEPLAAKLFGVLLWIICGARKTSLSLKISKQTLLIMGLFLRFWWPGANLQFRS